jgi:Mrp family chromosome partitioning ATPase
MPPGTGDVALSVFQMLPVDGVVIVSTPQDLVKMIVGKAVSMCNQMNMKIVGLVENMAYMKCPCCNNPIYPFGVSKLDDVCETFNLKPLASLPINPDLTTLIDSGKAEEMNTDYADSFVKEVIDFN